MAAKRQPLREHLVETGLAEDAKQANAYIMAGKILINNQPARAGARVMPGDEVRLRGQGHSFASKGGLKLSGALAAFEIKPEGAVCLDAGASTGGFTDCLLRHGAALVYAVDVGFGQLTGALRQDPRVINLERTNLADADLLALDPAPALATCDLSYLSLLDAVPLYRAILRGRGTLIALVKPLFEIDDTAARRSGLIADTAYEPLLARLADQLNQQEGTRVIKVCASPVTGNAGTLEFFFHLVFGQGKEKADLRGAIRGSVEAALRTRPYKKAGDQTLG